MSSTKLSALCDKVLEIAWLLALIITPLFFNVYSSRVFEPDKLTTLRTLALIMAAVWLVKMIEDRVSGERSVGFTWRTPLVLPTLFFVGVYLLSSILSVTPRVSLLGSYQRLQGTYTTLAYVVVFLIILQGLRTRAQLDRLILVVILNSLPIALYGLIQHSRLDPLPWGGDVTRRVASNMGNPIFVAAYLIMAAIPTLARVTDAFRSILTDEEANAADVPRAAAYIFIFLVQLIAIWYTRSRGPLMGLLAGLGVWVFLGLLTLQRAARQGQRFHPREILWDAGKGLAFGFGSLAGAGVVGVLLYGLTGALAALTVAGDARVAWFVLVIAMALFFVGLWLASTGRQLGWYLAGIFGGLGIIQLIVLLVGGRLDAAQLAAAGGAMLAFLGAWLTYVVNRRGWRWMWISALGIVFLFAIGFLLINPGGPLHEWALESPLNRVARVLQHESGTGKVRNLIWEGSLDLILPHEPIEYPPTWAYPSERLDAFNGLRPLVGYGPESMYVAYNRFYPPLLGHYESRTASPDRSHNETMDSLVITGLLGFGGYLWLFGSAFYFGLRWLGFLTSRRDHIAFFALQALGAIVAVIAVSVLVGPHFFGLAIPVGIVGGMFVYLVIHGFSAYGGQEETPGFHPDLILLIGILSAIVAHFVEINFGIAIASTRTTFWAYAGVLVVVGMARVREPAAAVQGMEDSTRANKAGSKKRRKRRRAAETAPRTRPAVAAWMWQALALGVIGGFVLGTLAFDFTTNAERLSEPAAIVWRSLTVLPAQQSRASYGALMIFGFTWLMSAVIFVSEMARSGAFRRQQGDWSLATVIYLLVSLAMGLGFALILAGRQAALIGLQARTMEEVLDIADRIAGLLTAYYGFILFALIAGGVVLFLGMRKKPRLAAHPWGALASVVLAVLISAVSMGTNLAPIQADVVFKQADPYDKGRQWPVAIAHYKHAIDLAPREDFYYLYLGRAYLEYATAIEDPAVRDDLMRETEQTLIQAREINPLNTDHSANLARMYRRWADFVSDEDMRRSLLQLSADNYEIATSLSSQNALLWNEWAMLYFYGMGDVAGYERTFQRSLAIDPEFDQTWLMCGDVSRQQNKLEEAARCYEEALRLNTRASQVWRALGDTYIAMQRWGDAIDALEQTVELEPEAGDIWNIHQVLAQLHSQIGQQEQALAEAQVALQLAPQDQRDKVQELVAQLQALEQAQP